MKICVDNIKDAVAIFRGIGLMGDYKYDGNLQKKERDLATRYKRAAEMIVDAMIKGDWHSVDSLFPDEGRPIMLTMINGHEQTFVYTGSAVYKDGKMYYIDIDGCNDGPFWNRLSEYKIRWKYI